MNPQPIFDRMTYMLGGSCCCVSFLLFSIIVWILIEKRKR